MLYTAPTSRMPLLELATVYSVPPLVAPLLLSGLLVDVPIWVNEFPP
jgi:hypothetical protein